MATATKTVTNSEGTFKVKVGGNMDKASSKSSKKSKGGSLPAGVAYQTYNNDGSVKQSFTLAEKRAFDSNEISSGRDTPYGVGGKIMPIKATDLSPVTAANIPTPKTENYAGTLAGLTASMTSPASVTTPTDPNAFNVQGLSQLTASLFEQNPAPDNAALYKKLEKKNQLRQKEQDVNNYTSTLNGIVAKSQADQLSVTGQGRGIPEVIIGGQQAQIAKEAAIQALPVAAQLAAAQGNLELAQQHVNTMFNILSKDAENKWQFKNKLIDTVITFATEGERNRLDQLKTKAAQDFQIKREDIAYGRQKALAQYGGGGSSNQTIDNERALLTQFRGEQIVKDYNTILAKKQSVDSIVNSGVGGPGDLAVVYEFMKGLDPTSVVRETEYATAAKSGNIFAGQFAKFNGYLRPNGGFLPPSVKQSFQSIVNSKLKVQQNLYDNVVKEYQDVATRQNLNPQNVILNYAGADNTPPPSKEDDIFNGVLARPAEGNYFTKLWNAIIGT
jgi:hypothetical protein